MGEHEFRILKDDCTIPGTRVFRDGVHFGYYARSEERPSLVLYQKGSEEIFSEIDFPGIPAAGNFYTMKLKLPADQYEYNFRDGGTIITDPYARRIAGRECYGEKPSLSPNAIRGAFVTGNYRWDGDRLLQIPFHEIVMYHLHVRGFTMHKNSGVRQKGTFAGLKHKASYLKSLGVNQVKLMPVYEFPEVSLPSAPSGSPLTEQEAAAHALDVLPREQVLQKNFWGYGKGFYFAPKASYAFSDRPDVEFKDMVREFHVNGIEVILEFAFDESADIGMICECLNYWAGEYHVDGFSLVGRDNLAGELAHLPLFSTRKLICGWYPSERSDENTGGKAQLLARSNDGFMNDARRLLKGDTGFLEAFAWRTRLNPSGYAQVNYVTNHDGFTLMDLVSYNEKHNEANDEMGRDGSDSNFSWNCGKEGPSSKRLISQLRMRQRKNAYAMLLLSQGTPMLLAGDEFGNSQLGNNNPWCHDSELTWLDWSRSKSARELTGFVQQLISYRKGHPVLHQKAEPQCSDYLSSGYPDLSYHGERAWFGDLNSVHLHFGCMYSGSYAGEEGFLYIAWNFHWEEQQFALPILPESYSWYRVMDTFQTESFSPSGQEENLGTRRSFSVTPRTVVLLEGRKDESVKTLKKSYEKSQNDLAKSKRTSENHHGA